MRNLILILTTGAFIFCGCSFDESIIPDQSEDQDVLLLTDATAKKSGPVFTVYPTGVNDTDNILQAFEDAKEAGPGATVKLMEGSFYINELEIRDFEGVFMGAGMNKTTIVNYGMLPCVDMLFNRNILSALITFVGGDMTISDMTLRIQDGYACDDTPEPFPFLNRDLFAIITVGDYSGEYMPVNRWVKSHVKNVKFIGGEADESVGPYQTSHNTLLGIWCGATFNYIYPLPPLTNGDFTVSNCEFDFFLDGAEGAALGDAVMVVEENLFKNCPWPLYFTNNAGAEIYIKNNVFENVEWFDIWIDDFDWGLYDYGIVDRRMYYEITGNTFSGPTSLLLQDWRTPLHNDEFPNFFVVKNNQFNTGEGGTGISFYNVKDAVVRNNQFKGMGSAGIYIDADPAYLSENVLMLGNNFNGASYDEANIWLSENVTDCTVVGGNNKGNVIDDGTDNKITGMNVHHGNGKVGPTVTDNLRIARERIKK